MLVRSIVCVVLFAAGAVAGAYTARPSSSPVAEPASVAEPETPGVAKRASGTPGIADLRARVKELEAKIAARKSGDAEKEVAEIKAKRFAETNDVSWVEDDPSVQKPSLGAQRLETLMRMRDEDPKQFTHTTNRIVRMGKWKKQQAERRLAYLNTLDTSKMTEDEKLVHDELVECQRSLADLSEISKVWDRPAEVEDARSAEERLINDNIVRLYQSEAKTIIRLKAAEMGFTGDDSEEIADTIAGLLKATYNSTQYTGEAD